MMTHFCRELLNKMKFLYQFFPSTVITRCLCSNYYPSHDSSIVCLSAMHCRLYNHFCFCVQLSAQRASGASWAPNSTVTLRMRKCMSKAREKMPVLVAEEWITAPLEVVRKLHGEYRASSRFLLACRFSRERACMHVAGSRVSLHRRGDRGGRWGGRLRSRGSLHSTAAGAAGLGQGGTPHTHTHFTIVSS